MTGTTTHLGTLPPASGLAPAEVEPVESVVITALDLLNGYAHIFVVAFLVTLLATPLVRRVAVAAGVVDHPDEKRKLHPYPVAYLGGVAVFLGLLVAIGVSYLAPVGTGEGYAGVPIAVMIGMVAITVTGLADDVWGWDPRLKIAGQLVAAAALAVEDIGVRVAEGLLAPLMGRPDEVLVSLFDLHLLNGHLYYWIGTALIAVFVLGGSNAANLIDGLDGLLSGTVGIVAIGLLAICLLIAPQDTAALRTTAALADVVVAQREAEIDRYRAREGVLPASLATLRADVDATGPPVELPAGWRLTYEPASGAVEAEDRRQERADAIHAALSDEVRLYRQREGRYPKTLDTLVADGVLAEKPEIPFGYAVRYDPNSGRLDITESMSTLTGARIVLCLALLGAVLGFLPHNFKPATIFLGDCGSLLLGFMCVVIILMLGDLGQTYFVFAGLIVFALPIMDTVLAIIRRLLAGTSLSAADDQHLHHQLKRALGGVARAVLALYGISALFAIVGVSLVALVLNGLRVRVIYAIALVLFSFIAVVAVKAARRQRLLAAMAPFTRDPPESPA